MPTISGSNQRHPITGALFMPDFFHQFIMPTIPEWSALPMHPLDWEFGVRPDRPFEGLARRRQTQHNQDVSIPRWPNQPAPRPQYPTAYYLEQRRYYEGEDIPFPDEPLLVVEAAPDPRWQFFVVVSAALRVLSEIAVLLFGSVKKVLKRAPENRLWECVVSAVVAFQIVKFLPKMGGADSGGGEWSQEQAPLYVIMIPNPKQFGKLFNAVYGSRWFLTVSRKGSGYLRVAPQLVIVSGGRWVVVISFRDGVWEKGFASSGRGWVGRLDDTRIDCFIPMQIHLPVLHLLVHTNFRGQQCLYR